MTEGIPHAVSVIRAGVLSRAPIERGRERAPHSCECPPLLERCPFVPLLPKAG
jgi:hypothetical protein